jgi:hypothetical protein
MALDWQRLCALARALPEVTEGIWFRTPSLQVRQKSFVRLKEDGRTVVFLTQSVDEQEALCEGRPAIYYITDHYRGYPAVLARLAALTVAEARVRLERAWRTKAPKRLVQQFDAGTDVPPAATGAATRSSRPRAGRIRSATSDRETSAGVPGRGSGAGTRAARATPARPAAGRRR